MLSLRKSVLKDVSIPDDQQALKTLLDVLPVILAASYILAVLGPLSKRLSVRRQSVFEKEILGLCKQRRVDE